MNGFFVWTEGEANPKSGRGSPRPIPIGLGPRPPELLYQKGWKRENSLSGASRSRLISIKADLPSEDRIPDMVSNVKHSAVDK